MKILRSSTTLALPSISPLRRPPPPRLSAFLSRPQVRFRSGPYGYTQAKALVFSKNGEPSDVLELHTHSISPQLRSGTALIQTLAAPINPADINTIQGTYGAKAPFTSLIGTPEPSAVPGSEGVFQVLAVDDPNSQLQKGDWVIPAVAQFGTWRTHAVAKTHDLLKVDKEGLTPTQAATVSVNPCTAYRMLRSYGPNAGIQHNLGMRPLEVGSGAFFIQNGANSGVGRAAIQFGKLWGLRSINVIRERDTKEQTEALIRELKDLGADEVVTETQLLSREWKDQLAHLTRNGLDKIGLGLNCVGGKSATALARSLSQGGTLVSYGAMSKQPLNLPVGLLIFRDVRFVGFWVSECNRQDPVGREQMIRDILQLTREGWFRHTPVQEVEWTYDTDVSVLKMAAQQGLQGQKTGKDVFVFKDT